MKEKLNCAVYTRVSSDNQTEVEFSSCDAQKERIEYFIKSQEGFCVYDVYSDEGYSGKDLNRPGLQRMLADIVEGIINCVVTYKMDRLTRSPKDFYQLIEYFEKYKVDFISVTERFDTSTPSGRLLRNIMLTFAQFERELASERTKDKMLQMVQKGMWYGGIPPFGYKGIDKKLTKIENETRIVKEIFVEFEKTENVAKVYNYLKLKGYKTRNGKDINKTMIRYILQNIVYAGKLKYGGKIYQGNHEPIISEELFNKVQKYFKHKKRRWRQYKTFLFKGLVRCANCNAAMSPCFSTKKNEIEVIRYYYYRCINTFKHNWSTCDIKYVSAERLENYIFDCLNRMSVDGHYLYSSSLGRESRIGHGQNALWSENELKSLQKYIKEFLKAAEKITGTEKCQYIKNYVADIIYSKETIQVNLYWRDYLYNNQGSLGQASEESHTHPQVDRYKGKITDGEMYKDSADINEDTAGGVCDDPRRSAEGRSAEGQNRRSPASLKLRRVNSSGGGILPSEELCSERGIESKKLFLLKGQNFKEEKNKNSRIPHLELM